MALDLFTSESVTEGHPDKICDIISDAILDSILAQDKDAHVACETMATTGQVHIAGEISTSCYVDIPKVVRREIKNIGYTNSAMGFDAETCAVLVSIDEQSPDIAGGVKDSLETRSKEEKQQGAGDQGMMFGYATNETKELMPAPILLAHKLTKHLADIRKMNMYPYLRPDGKSQVTIAYENGVPKFIDTVVVSTQHDEYISQEDLAAQLIPEMKSVLPENLLDDSTRFLINPSGRFVLGGPHADAGLTGRKIIVDTYGGMGRHGGGAWNARLSA